MTHPKSRTQCKCKAHLKCSNCCKWVFSYVIQGTTETHNHNRRGDDPSGSEHSFQLIYWSHQETGAVKIPCNEQNYLNSLQINNHHLEIAMMLPRV